MSKAILLPCSSPCVTGWMRCHFDCGRGGREAGECSAHSLPEKPTGPNQALAMLTQLGPGIDPSTVLGSRNVPGLAGENITSAGNRLARSGFHTGHKPPEPGHSKPRCVGKGEREVEGISLPSRHESRSQEDLHRDCSMEQPALRYSTTGPDSYLPGDQHELLSGTEKYKTQCTLEVNARAS